MADKIKPLKMENAASGGTQNDPFPTEANPTQDYLAAKGLALENNDNRLIDLDGSGNIQFKDFTETTYIPFWKLRRALYEIFDPGTSGMVSTNSEDAIKEANQKADDADRFYVFASYGGNAGVGRYLEVFSNINMLDAPLESPEILSILTIVARTTDAAATCTIGFYNIQPVTPVLLYTVTFSAQKKVTLTATLASPLFVLPAGGQLAIKIDSGSIGKPHVYFTAHGG
jgi:hypothetical protein